MLDFIEVLEVGLDGWLFGEISSALPAVASSIVALGEVASLVAARSWVETASKYLSSTLASMLVRELVLDMAIVL